MAVYEQGTAATFDGLTETSQGALVDADSIEVSIIDATGDTVVNLATPTHVGTGHYQYTYNIAADAEQGAWIARWFATINGDVIAPVDEGFTVVRQGALQPPVAGGLTCTPWATSDDAPASFLEYGIDLDEVDVAFQMAGDILFELTGRRWPGICSDVIRPCAKYHSAARSGRWYSSMGTLSSPWGWCSCNRADACGCSTIPSIKLPGSPVIPESLVVKVDGETLVNGVDYRLDDHRYLVRIDGNGWRCCQDMRLADTEERTMSVAYDYGSMPDLGGVRSATLLGQALFGELFPDTAERCKVPSRARSITRSGVVIDFGDDNAIVATGITGIDVVDMWVTAKNLGLSRRPATVVIPGVSRLARRVGA